MCQYDTFCLKIAWACKIYIFSGAVWGIVVKGGEIVSSGGDGDERGEGVERVGVADCGGWVWCGENREILECVGFGGVGMYYIIYIIIYNYIIVGIRWG